METNIHTHVDNKQVGYTLYYTLHTCICIRADILWAHVYVRIYIMGSAYVYVQIYYGHMYTCG